MAELNNISSKYDFDYMFKTSFKMAVDCINKLIDNNPDYEWIKKEYTFPSYENLLFRYKNTVFSVLIDLQDITGKSYLQDDLKQLQYKASLDFNTIPCLFPALFKKENNTIKIKPKFDGIGLCSAKDYKLIIPEKFASDTKIKMSELEIRNIEIKFAIDYLKSKKYSIKAFQDILHTNPQIWFEDENHKMNWLILRSKKSLENDITPFESITSVKRMYPKSDGYYLELLINSNKTDHNIYRGDTPNIKLIKFEKIYDNTKIDTQKKDLLQENVYDLILHTIRSDINVSNNQKRTSVYSVPGYDNLLLRLPYALVQNINLLKRELCLLPIKYEDDTLVKNSRFGLPLYYVDSDDSMYAKRGYVTPKEVLLFDSSQIGLSIIKKVDGNNVLSTYSYFLQSLIGQTGQTDFHDYSKIMQIKMLYGNDAVIKTLENLKNNVYTIMPKELANNSKKFEFTKTQDFYVFYISCVKNYLITLKKISELPQETYLQAVNDIISKKEFVFDFSNPTNVFINFETETFNFIDFVFEDKYINSVSQETQLTGFRDSLLGIYTQNLVQPEDILYYPNDIDLYKTYQAIITQKINNACPKGIKIKNHITK